MSAWPPPPQAIFVLIIITLIVTAGIAYSLLAFARFLAYRRAGVNPFDDADDDMSSDEEGEDDPRTAAPAPPAYHRAPDTYQANVSTARRTGTRRSDAEWIAELATARAPDGKYRFTANAIAALVGGTRKDALDQVRAIRNLPQWPETTPEQQARREALGLQNR